jgi:hypothetical protein
MDYKIFGLAIMFLLCWMGYSPLASRSTIVWSDDFSDAIYNEWTIVDRPMVNPLSNWTAADNCLQIDQDDSGTITHPSSVAYGTWSFDFKVNENEVRSGTGAAIAFISNDIHNMTSVVEPADWQCYWLRIRSYVKSEGGYGLSFQLRKWYDDFDATINASETHLSVTDWNHLAVTRNTTGFFSVYYNGTEVMQGEGTEITTSELFVVSLNSWCMIDNVVVRDDVLPPPPPTTTTTTPPPTTPPPAGIPLELLALGIGVPVVIIVIVVGMKMRRS